MLVQVPCFSKNCNVSGDETESGVHQYRGVLVMLDWMAGSKMTMQFEDLVSAMLLVFSFFSFI